jgi:hypothetical protein
VALFLTLYLLLALPDGVPLFDVAGVRGEQDDDLHADVLVAVNTKTAQLLREVEHLLHPLLQLTLLGRVQAQGHVLGHPVQAVNILYITWSRCTAGPYTAQS